MPYRLLALTIAAIPATAIAQLATPNWDQVDAGVKAICKRVGRPKPPAADRPSAAQIKALRGCDSAKLYYGEGVKPDYRKARQCAFVEAQAADAPVFHGDTILMQIYANGFGVKRDPDLATAYACGIDGAPMEIAGRISHLQSLKTKPDSFDYCDDITSGWGAGACEARDSKTEAAARNKRLNALLAKLPPAARPLYAAAKKSFDAFVDARGDGEVDLSGTLRAADVIAEQDHVRDQFLKDLERLISNRWPVATPTDAKSTDTLLNASYRKALAWAAGKDNSSTIKGEAIRKTQRAWLIYRDAYVRFAAATAPQISADAVRARLSRLRTAQLDQLSSS